MSEEVQNADVTVPWSMLITTLANGAFGFGIVIAVLFVTVDIQEVLSSPTGELGFPYMQIFYQSTGSKGGATAMIAIILVMTVCGTIASLATASRLIWAFARDHGLPFSRHVSKVSSFLLQHVKRQLSSISTKGPDRELNSNIRRHHCLQRRLPNRLDQSRFLSCLQRCHIAQCQQSIRILHHHRRLSSLPPTHWRHKVKR